MARTQTKEREPAPDFLKDVTPAKPGHQPPKSAPAAKATTKNAVAKIAPAKPPASVMSGLAELLKDPDLDPAKAKELYELYMLTEAKQQFHDAMIVMDEKLPRINKDGKIEFRDTTKKPIAFASFENLNRQIKPFLRDHGFRLNFQPDTAPGGQGLVVHCHLTRGLYRESCTVPVSTSPASPAMNAQQSVGAAISYAKRYGAIALLNIETEAPLDRDTNATTDKKKLRPTAGAAAEQSQDDQPEPDAKITGPQAKQLLKVMDECNIEGARFMEKYKVAAVHELPAALFDEAIKSCRDYAAAKAAKDRAAKGGAGG
jgi:hypothetical protein